MFIPDVRFGDGYEKLIKMRDSLIKQMDLKEFQDFTKALFEDLDYYRRMADYHAPIGLTDDARRVRRLERELEKVTEALNEFPFLSLGEDGSIIMSREVGIQEIQSLVDKFIKSKNDQLFIQANQNLETKVDALIDRVEEISDKVTNSEPSTFKTIILGVLINFISSLIIPSSAGEDHTYIVNNNVENHYQQVEVFNHGQNTVLFFSDIPLREEPYNDADIVTKLNGLLVLKIHSLETEWFLIELNQHGKSITGWVRRDSVISYTTSESNN